MLRVDGRVIRLKLLAIAAGVDHAVNVIGTKERQGGHRIGELRIGRPHRFKP